MRNALKHIMLLVAVVLFSSCERRGLFDEMGEGMLMLNLNLALQIENEDEIEEPDVMVAAFFHQNTKEVLHREYLGPHGGAVDINPGKYHLLVYNFDTYSTHIREDHHAHTIEAYTNQVQEEERSGFDAYKQMKATQTRQTRGYMDEPLIYEPDHFYVCKEEDLFVTGGSDGQRQQISEDATSIVKVYTIEIGPITNAKRIANATVYLTGQAQSVLLNDGTVTGEPCTIYFPIQVDSEGTEFVGKFRTFGSYPGSDNKVYLIVDFVDHSGNHNTWEWDVTDQIDGGGTDININEDIDIPGSDGDEEDGGGFDPTVNLWEENSVDIEI